MMDELIKPKLSQGASDLRDLLVDALKLGPVVRLDMQEFASGEDITIRSAQRYAKAVEECPEFSLIKRYGSQRYFCRKDVEWRSVLSADHEFVSFNDMTNDPSVASVVSVVPILYIYIYTKKEDLRKRNDTNDTNDNLSDNGVSAAAVSALVVDETTADNAFQEMVSMVCYVCRRTALMLLDEEEALLEKMFRAGVTSDLVYARYSRATTPNFWYAGYWKGKNNNAWPTFKDVFTTWEFSGDYSPQPYDSWPTLKEIQDTMIAIMAECGAKKPETAVKRYAEEGGYDVIINQIPGGYVHMARVSETEFRIKIATAVREIKQKARKG